MMADYAVLKQKYDELPKEVRELFADFVSERVDSQFLKGKKVLVNIHQDRITWLLIYHLHMLGAEVEAAQVNVHALPIAAETLKAAGIPFYRDGSWVSEGEKNPIPDTKRVGYYDYVIDCGDGLHQDGTFQAEEDAFRLVVEPKIAGSELTYVDPRKYEGRTVPYGNATTSHTKKLETGPGTGGAFIDSLIEWRVLRAEKAVAEVLKKQQRLGELKAEIEKLRSELHAYAQSNANKATTIYLKGDDDAREDFLGDVNTQYLDRTDLPALHDEVIKRLQKKNKLSPQKLHTIDDLTYGGTAQTVQLRALIAMLKERAQLLPKDHDKFDYLETDDRDSDNASEGDKGLLSTSPPSTSPSLAKSHIRRHSGDAQDGGSSLPRTQSSQSLDIKAQTFLIFGGGNVGIGIAESLMAKGVPAESISIVEVSEARVKQVQVGRKCHFVSSENNDEKVKALLQSHDVIVTATGVANVMSDLLTKLKMTKAELKGEWANMGHNDEWGPEFEDKEMLGYTKLALNFNLDRLAKDGGGYPTDPKFLVPIFFLLIEFLRAVEEKKMELKNGFNSFVPAPKRLSGTLLPEDVQKTELELMDINALTKFCKKFPGAATDQLWRYLPPEFLKDYMSKKTGATSVAAPLLASVAATTATATAVNKPQSIIPIAGSPDTVGEAINKYTRAPSPPSTLKRSVSCSDLVTITSSVTCK